MAKGFDCATKLNVASARRLYNERYQFAARYLGNSWKSFNKAEAAAIQNVGLKLISIFQKSANHASYFKRSNGVADAKLAMQWAKDVGQPKGSAIYFAVDFNAQSSHIKSILEYVDGVVDTMKDYKVGLYGNYTVMQAVKGKVDYYWQTYAWSSGKVADHIHMHQYHNDTIIAGVAIDKNNVIKSPGHWGDPVKNIVEKVNTSGTYKVKSGDTLNAIAKAYNIPVATIVKLNNIKDKDVIEVGQVLKLKDTTPNEINSIKVVGKIKIVGVKKAAYICDKPSQKSRNISTIGLGKEIEISGSVPGWFEVIFQGKRAYVNEKYGKRV